MKFFDCRRFVWVFMLLLVTTCVGCTGNSATTKKKPITSIQQLNDPAYTITMAEAGPPFEAVKRELPKAKRLYLNGQPAYDAVRSGKVDAYAEGRVMMDVAVANGLSGVKILPDKIGDPIDIAIGISKKAKYPGLKDKLNTFIAEMKANGTLQDMYKRWVNTSNHKMPDISVPEKADTKLVVGTTGLVMPFSYYEGTSLTGYDVELSKRFAKWLGAELEFKVYNFEGIVTAAVAGDVDCVMSNLFVTPERAERMDFSDPVYIESVAVMVKDDAPVSVSEHKASAKKGYASISDFNGKRIGVFTSTIHDQIVNEVLPDAKVVYFDALANAVSAINAGKVEAFAIDEQIVLALEQENSTVRHFDEYLNTCDNAFIVAKSPEGDKIRAQLDEFIRYIKADGTLESIRSIWAGTDEDAKTLPDYENYPATNGTIRIAAESEAPPFSYIKYGRHVGYEIDIIARFCKAYGYRPSIDPISFPGILPAVKSGKYMIGIGSFTITEERKESVNFTEPTYTGGTMLLIKNTPQDSKASAAPAQATPPAKYTRLADLRGKKIGIQTGVDSWARLVKELIPDAEVMFFNDITSLAAALESRKIDAFLEGNVAMAMLMAVNKNITVLNENISRGYSSAVALRRDAKGEKLKAQWDEYITALKSAGKIDALMDKWTGADESAKTLPNYESLPAPNGVLVMASDGNYPPLSYYSGNKLVGFEMDLAAGFCERYGYGLKILLMSYSGMLPALATGKCDFSIAGASINEEHKETLTLSVPYYTYTTKVAVLAAENGGAAPEVRADSGKFAALADLNGKRIGVPTGVDEWAVILNKELPDAELVYYNSTADQIAALESGKIEAFPCDEPVLRFLMAQNKNIAMLDEAFPEGYDAGVVFPKTEKGQKLQAQWNEYLTFLKDTGKLEALVQKWTGTDESAKTIPDYESLPSPNGILKTATNGDYPPFNYFKNNKLAGLEVDLAVGFCQAYGYGLEFKVVNYDGILPSVQSGKSDFALAALTLTEEHAEKMLFSVPYYTFTTNIAVLAANKATPPETTPLSSHKLAAPEKAADIGKDPRIAALNGQKIGVITGVDAWADIVHKLLPDSEVVYYNNFTDMALAVTGKKIAAFVCDIPVLDMLMMENKNIASTGTLLEESIDIAVGFPKAEKSLKLKSQWNEFITNMKDSGELDSIINRWTRSENPQDVPDYDSLPATNGVLTMATDGENPPFSYYIGNKLAGFEVELAVRFCAAYGYGLKFKVMAYDAIIAAIQSERCDFSLADIPPSQEHAENLLFSIPYYACATTFAVSSNSPLAAKTAAPESRARFSSIQDLAGKRIGVVVGTTGELSAKKYIPDVNIVYFDGRADVLTALKLGKIDAVCIGYNSARFLTLENEDLALLGNAFAPVDSAAIFAKTQAGRKLCAQFSEFLDAKKANGTLQEMEAIWFGKDDSLKTARDFSGLPATNGTLKLAVTSVSAPFAYIKDNKILGYDIDCAVMFCEEYGYGLKIEQMNFAAMLPAVVSGKCDFALSNISVTEERKESVLFSSANMQDGDGILIRKEDAPAYAPEESSPKLSAQTPKTSAPESRASSTSFKDLAGKKIAVTTGMTHGNIALQYVPDAKLLYFDTVPDTFTALKTMKADAVCTALEIAQIAMAQDDSFALFGEQLTHAETAPIFPKTDKGRKLCAQFSEFIKLLWDDGTVQKVHDAWFGSDESSKTIKDYTKFPAPNGILRAAVDSALAPYIYVKDNRIVGYDVDLVSRFCEAYGYGLEIVPMNFAGVIPAVQSGRCDFGIGAITITDERKESVLFSYPFMRSGNVFVVRKANVQPAVQAASAHRARLVSFKDLSGKKIAVTTGSIYPQITLRAVPDAELVYFNSDADSFAALEAMKVDAACTSWEGIHIILAANDKLAVFGEMLDEGDMAPIFQKNEKGRKICGQFSEFVKTLWDNGTIDELYNVWFGIDESKKVIKDYTKLPAPNGTLKLAANDAAFPSVYVKDNKIVGYDVDVIVRFCEKYGYGLEIIPMNIAGIIPAVISGKADIGTSGFGVTEERKESVLFSYPFMKGGNIFLVRKEDIHSPDPNAGITNISELNGKRIGVQTGTTHPQIASHYVPLGKQVFFDNTADVFTALKAGKIDAVCTNTPIARFIMINDDTITMLGDEAVTMDCSPIFPKTQAGEKLREQFSEFIRSARSNGTLQEIDSIWFGKDDSKRNVKDYSKLPAPNGKLRMVTDPTLVPFAYVKNNRIVGYEVDCAVRFCEAYGYGLEVVPMNFGALIPALMSGKYDFAACSIAYTPERAENVLYAESNLKSGYAFFVKKPKIQSQPSQQSQPAPITAPAQISGGRFTSIHDLAEKKVAVQTGTIAPQIVSQFIPTAELVYFDTQTDMVTALRAEKVDALCTDAPIGKTMMSGYSGMTICGDPLTDDKCAPIFAKTEKGHKLCEQFSEFAKACWGNGTIQELESIWYGADDSRKVVKDYTKLPAPNGKLRMAADPTCLPFVYMKGNRIVGYDVDFVVRFCEAYGYGLEIAPMNFGAMIPAVLSGKCDFAASSITITEERADSVLFAEPNEKSGISLFVRKSDTQTQAAPQNQAANTSGQYNSIQELAGKKIGVQTGTTNEALVAEYIPTATREYFNTLPDALIALKTGKIDAICCSVYAARYMMIENDDIMYLEPMLKSLELVPIFSPTEKGRKLREDYSEFVKGLWTDGTINEIDSIWLGKDNSKRVLKDYSKLPAPNGILKMASEPTDIPFVYMKDNQFVGYDVDIAVRFCEAKGYGLEVVPMGFPAVIPSINSGKTDFSASMHWTPERAESALFSSTPTAHSGNVIVVMKAQPAQSEGEYSTFEELAGKNIGAQTGTPNDKFTLNAIPTANMQYFDSITDIVTAIKMRKIEAGAIALNAARFMMIDNEDLALMGKPLAELDAAPIFAKNDKGRKLCEQFNTFIKAQWENGYLQELDSIWFSRDDSKRQPTDYASLPAPNGKLRMAVDTSLAPFAYVKDNRIVGYEIDFAAKFCKEHGYGLEVIPMNFGAIIAAVQSGKCDFASCTIAITPERAEQVLFASPNAKTGCALVIRKGKPQPQVIQPKAAAPSPTKTQAVTTQAEPSQFSVFMEDAREFFENLKASFNRTFIREERWRLFIEGIINTMIITVLSIICGTILGFVVYLLCRGGNVFANLLTRFFVWLIQGTPMVVLLMILYYIIFGEVDIPGIWVAVIAFTLTFGAGVLGMLKSGTGALDRGQTEAAYALGFTDTQTFFRVILPQAALHFMPAYKAEVVALIKATAIVGYIAVQDLTKMGDIVRSRTYEAFFPLIAVAAIYFVLAGMLNIIVGIIHNRIRPEKRTKDDILKGVDTHD